jgi:hypothetical protein
MQPYKSTAAILSLSLPSALFAFDLVIPKHALSPCFGHAMGVKGT